MIRNKQRSPSLIAASVAVPVALAAGLIVFFTMHGSAAPSSAAASASPSVATNLATVDMPVPTLNARHSQMCLAFVSQIPTTTDNATGVLFLGKLQERQISGGSEQNAAFGDPPITAACGVAPVTPAPTDEVFEMNGVCWYAQQGATASTWTTLDREVPIAVTVPNSYGQAAQYTNLFSDAVFYAMPTLPTPYVGCTQPASAPTGAASPVPGN